MVAIDEETGRLVTTKTPSTPSDPAEGFLDGVQKVLSLIESPRKAKKEAKLAAA